MLYQVGGIGELLIFVKRFSESEEDEVIANYALQAVCYSIVDSDERKQEATKHNAVAIVSQVSANGSNEHLRRLASILLACCTATE